MVRGKRQGEREREVAQMRDDENIGSISKFYFGASAERRARARFYALGVACTRARESA